MNTDWIAKATLLVSLITLVVLVIGLRETIKAFKADFHYKLINELRNSELYEGLRYIHTLRQEWKSHPRPEWGALAEEWVRSYVPPQHVAEGTDPFQSAPEWRHRRTVSQFVSKMGALVKDGYLDQNTLFKVAPEIPRLLLVLDPIERAIQLYWSKKEKGIADWDQPFPKWEFKYLMERYDKWYEKDGLKLKRPVSPRMMETLLAKYPPKD